MEDFAKILRKIVDAGGTPVVVCNCGYKTWMFEGLISEAEKTFTKSCRSCQSIEEKTLLADLREDLL